ncbi:MAG: PH domain-containing protein [Gordonia sp. (in: high G+C Gram-positive bacteria)]
MDNPADLSTGSWATPKAAGLAMVGAGIILIVAGIVAAADPAGRVLVCVAGLMLSCLGGYALRIRPRLVLSAGPTLTIRTLRGAHTYPAPQIERIRVLTLRRIGRHNAQLEIDVLPEPVAPPRSGMHADTSCVVLGRWDLGADVYEVADILRRAGLPVEPAS